MSKLMKLSVKVGIAAVLLATAGCGGNKNYAAKEDSSPRSGPKNQYDEREEGIFGPGGVTLGSILSSNSGTDSPGAGSMPVNRYLWHATLDTLSFLPLASTDPFTGVIATDWGATPNATGERFKVTAYMLSPALSASSLKVAVYREVRSEAGTWVPATVNTDTPKKIEDAILTRARQIRIADIEGETTKG